MNCLKNIRITCKCTTTLDIDVLNDFQGSLKTRTEKDYNLIENSIIKYGFSFPFFVWKSQGKNYVLDGHGRLEVLKKMKSNGWNIPSLPVVYVECDSESKAKDFLLRFNSHYGKVTVGNVFDFLENVKNFDLNNYQLPSFEKMNFSDTDFSNAFKKFENKNPLFSFPQEDKEYYINRENKRENNKNTLTFGKVRIAISDVEYKNLLDAFSLYKEKNGNSKGFIYEIFCS